MVGVEPLVTLDEARMQLEDTSDTQVGKIVMMMEQATGIILDYIDDPDVSWTTLTVPPAVHAAILWQLTWMYQHRGDEIDTHGIAPGVRTLLERTRRIPIA